MTRTLSLAAGWSSRELADRLFEGAGGFRVALPSAALLQERRSGSDREGLRIQPRLHLRPRERHGDKGSGAGARRERRDGRGEPIVPQVVEKYAPHALALRHRV